MSDHTSLNGLLFHEKKEEIKNDNLSSKIIQNSQIDENETDQTAKEQEKIKRSDLLEKMDEITESKSPKEDENHEKELKKTKIESGKMKKEETGRIKEDIEFKKEIKEILEDIFFKIDVQNVEKTLQKVELEPINRLSIEKFNKTIEELKSFIKEILKEKKDILISEEIKVLESKVLQLQEDIYYKNLNMEENVKTIDSLNKKIKENTIEFEDIKKEKNSQLVELKNSWDVECLKWKEKNENLSLLLKSSNSELEKLKEEIKNKENVFKNEMIRKDEELKKEIKERERIYKEEFENRDKLRVEFNKKENDLKEEMKKKEENLKEELKNKEKVYNEEILKTIKLNNEKVIDLFKSYDKEKAINLDLTKENLLLKATNKHNEKEIEELKQQDLQKKKEIEKLKNDLVELRDLKEKEKTNLETQYKVNIDKLKKDHSEEVKKSNQEKIEQVFAVTQEKIDLQTKNDILNGKIETLKKKFKAFGTSLSITKQKVSGLKDGYSSLSNLKQMLEKIKEENHKSINLIMNKVNIHITDSQNVESTLTKSIEEKNFYIKNQNQKISDLEVDKKELGNKNFKLEKEIVKKDEEIKGSKYDIEKLKSSHDNLLDKIKSDLIKKVLDFKGDLQLRMNDFQKFVELGKPIFNTEIIQMEKSSLKKEYTFMNDLNNFAQQFFGSTSLTFTDLMKKMDNLNSSKFAIKYSVFLADSSVKELYRKFTSELPKFVEAYDKYELVDIERDDESEVCLYFYKCGNRGIEDWKEYYAALKDFYLPNKKKKLFIGIVFTPENSFSTLVPSYTDLSKIGYQFPINPIRDHIFTFEFQSDDISKNDLYKQRMFQVLKILQENQK